MFILQGGFAQLQRKESQFSEQAPLISSKETEAPKQGSQTEASRQGPLLVPPAQVLANASKKLYTYLYARSADLPKNVFWLLGPNGDGAYFDRLFPEVKDMRSEYGGDTDDLKKMREEARAAGISALSSLSDSEWQSLCLSIYFSRQNAVSDRCRIEDFPQMIVYKHFPGGDSRIELTEYGMVIFNGGLAEFERYLAPFRNVISSPNPPGAIMTSHACYPELQKEMAKKYGIKGILPSSMDTPATFSPYILKGLLRQEFGYNGIIMTDWVNMDVIKQWSNGLENLYLFSSAPTIAEFQKQLNKEQLVQSDGTLLTLTDNEKNGIRSLKEGGVLKLKRNENLYRIEMKNNKLNMYKNSNLPKDLETIDGTARQIVLAVDAGVNLFMGLTSPTFSDLASSIMDKKSGVAAWAKKHPEWVAQLDELLLFNMKWAKENISELADWSMPDLASLTLEEKLRAYCASPTYNDNLDNVVAFFNTGSYKDMWNRQGLLDMQIRAFVVEEMSGKTWKKMSDFKVDTEWLKYIVADTVFKEWYAKIDWNSPQMAAQWKAALESIKNDSDMAR